MKGSEKMKATTIKALFALLAAACSSAAAAAISVDCAYPGGNVKVEKIDEAALRDQVDYIIDRYTDILTHR